MIKDFYKGNSVRIPIVFKRNGLAMDITDATVTLCLKRMLNDRNENAVVLQEITDHTNPTNGITEFFLSVDDTKDIPAGAYHYEILLTLSDSEALTIKAGRVQCIKGVYDV